MTKKVVDPLDFTKSLIEDWGLEVPLTTSDCEAVVQFVRAGNLAKRGDEEELLAYLRHLQVKMIGHKIHTTALSGKIVGVVPLNDEEIRLEKKLGKSLSVYKIIVEWDSGHRSQIYERSIRRVYAPKAETSL